MDAWAWINIPALRECDDAAGGPGVRVHLVPACERALSARTRWSGDAHMVGRVEHTIAPAGVEHAIVDGAQRSGCWRGRSHWAGICGNGDQALREHRRGQGIGDGVDAQAGVVCEGNEEGRDVGAKVLGHLHRGGASVAQGREGHGLAREHGRLVKHAEANAPKACAGAEAEKIAGDVVALRVVAGTGIVPPVRDPGRTLDDGVGAILVPDAVGIAVIGNGDVDIGFLAAGVDLRRDHYEALGEVVVEALGIKDKVHRTLSLEEAGVAGAAKVGEKLLNAGGLVIKPDGLIDGGHHMVWSHRQRGIGRVPASLRRTDPQRLRIGAGFVQHPADWGTQRLAQRTFGLRRGPVGGQDIAHTPNAFERHVKDLGHGLHGPCVENLGVGGASGDIALVVQDERGHRRLRVIQQRRSTLGQQHDGRDHWLSIGRGSLARGQHAEAGEQQRELSSACDGMRSGTRHDLSFG